MINPIRYISRTFNTIISDINSDSELVDTPAWWKRLIAGIGDVISMWNNAQANDSVLSTAFTRRAVVELCRWIGYEVSSQSTSYGTMLFYLKDGTTAPLTLATTELIGQTRGSVAVTAKQVESRASVSISSLETESVNMGVTPVSGNVLPTARTFVTGEKVVPTGTVPTGLTAGVSYYAIAATGGLKFATSLANAKAGTYVSISGSSGTVVVTLFSVSVTCYQQESKADTVIGIGSTAEWQQYDLPDTLILKDSVVITDSVDTFTRVDSFIDSVSTSAHFILIYRSDGSAYVEFGNGTYGKRPVGNITAKRAVGGGVNSNITPLNSIEVYAGSSSVVEGCTNVTAFTGGEDEESIETARRLAPATVKAQDRFVTEADGEALAEKYSPISQVKILRNEYGPLSCKVVTIAIGGGQLSGALQTALETYLIARSALSSIDVRVENATITAENIVSAFKAKTGYTYAERRPYFLLAWKLFMADSSKEIFDVYQSDGLASAIGRINSIFTESFDTDDATVETILERFLATEDYRTFGCTIDNSDPIAFIQNALPGVDSITYSAPTFPKTYADDEIPTYGTLTVTEIV